MYAIFHVHEGEEVEVTEAGNQIRFSKKETAMEYIMAAEIKLDYHEDGYYIAKETK
jgi:hypothetical protein